MQYEKDKNIGNKLSSTNVPDALQTSLTTKSKSSLYAPIESVSFGKKGIMGRQESGVSSSTSFMFVSDGDTGTQEALVDPAKSNKFQENSGTFVEVISAPQENSGTFVEVISAPQRNSETFVEVISQSSEVSDQQDWDKISPADRRMTFGYQNNEMPDEPQDEANMQNWDKINPADRRMTFGYQNNEMPDESQDEVNMQNWDKINPADRRMTFGYQNNEISEESQESDNIRSK